MTTQTKTTWHMMKFKDFADTSPSVKLERGKEYPFIPMDVVDGQNKFPNEIKHKKFSGGGAKFANGDTIFARITPCLENGKIVKIKDLKEVVGFGSTEFFVFRGKEKISDSDFVYYLSCTDTIRDPAIKSMVGASGRQRADKSIIENLKLSVPPFSTQKQIADVLSAYDDLIENNTKRIKILEQIAQAIYREWFGEKSKFKNQNAKSQFKIKKLGEVADIVMGQSPPSSSYNERGEDLPFFQGKAEFGETYPTPIKYCSSPSRIAEAKDILISVRAPVGNINIAKEKSCIGRGLGALRAKKSVLDQIFLFHFMKKNENNWSRLSTGSTFSAIKGSILKNFEIPLPPLETQKKIAEKLSAVQRYKVGLLEQKAKLKELFNSVLHKSMSLQ